MATITGTNKNDTLIGTANADIIRGGDGHDTLYGYDGNDNLFGDNGNDLLDGGNGNDTLDGGNGNDTLADGSGNDTLTGGNGNDIFIHNMSANIGFTDTVDGGNGTDTLVLELTNGQYSRAQNAINAFNAASSNTVFNFANYSPDIKLSVIRVETLQVNLVANHAPIAVNDTAQTNANQSVNVNVLTNDSDPDNDPMTISSFATTSTKGASIAMAAPGVLSYDPGLVFKALGAGESTTDTFSYAISDGFGGTSGATVTMTILGVNDAPTNIVLNQNSIAENSSNDTIIGQLSAVDPDASDTATYILLDNANGRFKIGGANNDQLLVNESRLLDYETQTTHTVTVRTTDSAGAQFDKTFTINLIDDTSDATNQVVTGTLGNDPVTTGAGRDTIKTLDGNDTVTAGFGNDTIDLGNGIDTAYADVNVTAITLSGNQSGISYFGNDSVTHGIGSNSNFTFLIGDAWTYTANISNNSNSLLVIFGNDQLNGGSGLLSLRGEAESITTNVTGDLNHVNYFFGDDTGNGTGGGFIFMDVTGANATIVGSGNVLNYQFGDDHATILGAVIGDLQGASINITGNNNTLTHHYGNDVISNANTLGLTSKGDVGDLTINLNGSSHNNQLTFQYGSDQVNSNGNYMSGDQDSLTFNFSAASHDNQLSFTFMNDQLTGSINAEEIVGDIKTITINDAGINNGVTLTFGNDVLTGGGGADIFTFWLSSQNTIANGIDHITDLTTADKLRFTHVADVTLDGTLNASDLSSAVSVTDGGAGQAVTITFLGDNSQIILDGIGTAGQTLNSLNALNSAGYSMEFLV